MVVAGAVHRADNPLARRREGVASFRRIHTAEVAHRQGRGCRAGKEAAGEEPANQAAGCSQLALEDPEGIQRAEHCILRAGRVQAAVGYIHRKSPAGVVDRWHVRRLSRPWCRTMSRWHRA